MGLLGSLLAGCAASPPEELGVREGRLAECPSAPRCVSSQAHDADKQVRPLSFSGPRDAAHDALLAVIRELPRSRLVRVEDDYIHVTQRSSWFGFVDDLECYLPADESVVHVRSSARIGYYDFGVNRARVERLRQAFQARMADSRP